MTGFLDWRAHAVGPLERCQYCRHKALMRDEEGRPAHKVCAEKRTRRVPAGDTRPNPTIKETP